MVSLLDHIEHILLRKTHWNILDHDSGVVLNAVEDGVEIDLVVCQLRHGTHILIQLLRGLWLA